MTSVPFDSAPPPTRLPFVILALIQATLIFTIALIMIPLPRIAAQFGLGSADILLLQVAYGLPFSGLLLFGGRLADRFEGRRMLMIGLLIFGGASLIAAFAPTFEVLVAMRFAEGIGGALVAPAAMTVLRGVFPDPKAFGEAMATWGGVSVLGAVVGFVASGVLTTWISWRWMFLAPVIVAAIGLAARSIMPMGPPGGQVKPLRLDLVGATLATAGIISASFGLIATGDHPWADPLVWLPLAAGALLFGLFVFVERHTVDPLLPPGFLMNPARAVGLLGMMCAAAGSVLIEYVLSLYLQRILGWTSLATALAFLPFVVALVAANTFAGAVVGRVGPAMTLIAGFAAAAVGFGLLTLLGGGISIAVLVGSQIPIAGGLALIFAGSAVLSTQNVPMHQAGLAGGVMNTTMELGPTVGLAALMAVAATQSGLVQGYAAAFGAAALAFVGMAAITLIVARRSGT